MPHLLTEITHPRFVLYTEHIFNLLLTRQPLWELYHIQCLPMLGVY